MAYYSNAFDTDRVKMLMLSLISSWIPPFLFPDCVARSTRAIGLGGFSKLASMLLLEIDCDSFARLIEEPRVTIMY